VYFIYSKNDNKCKIGFTKNPPMKRLKQLNTGNSSILSLLGYIRGDMNTERSVRNQFYSLRENLEWINIDNSLIDFINQNTITNTYCEMDNGLVRVYNKMKI
jgi:hypothetical protein